MGDLSVEDWPELAENKDFHSFELTAN